MQPTVILNPEDPNPQPRRDISAKLSKESPFNPEPQGLWDLDTACNNTQDDELIAAEDRTTFF